MCFVFTQGSYTTHWSNYLRYESAVSCCVGNLQRSEWLMLCWERIMTNAISCAVHVHTAKQQQLHSTGELQHSDLRFCRGLSWLGAFCGTLAGKNKLDNLTLNDKIFYHLRQTAFSLIFGTTYAGLQSKNNKGWSGKIHTHTRARQNLCCNC